MHVLVPMDDSEQARAALEFAAREHPDASITALHVVDPGAGPYSEGGIYAYDAVLESRQQVADALLEDAAELAGEYGVSLDTETTVGNAPREIVRFADEEGVDRIVIGSRGRSGAARVLLGSVAETVARRASVPVTIVR
ncbi:universal stress protein [Halopiger goleimassiliensis]|uniref:universal stress protein n=1 Tax=Halopiger goleimassiliensis TaxID=1293048 RepID=UPI0006782941|nr:universal stress protein [Halopiger goleimassiliensis]